MKREAVFNTITDADWRESIASGRRRVNPVATQIHEKLSAAGMGNGQNSRFGEAVSPAPGRVSLPPVAPLPGPHDTQANHAGATEVQFSAAGDARGASCAVSSATAGRDRQNF